MSEWAFWPHQSRFWFEVCFWLEEAILIHNPFPSTFKRCQLAPFHSVHKNEIVIVHELANASFPAGYFQTTRMQTKAIHPSNPAPPMSRHNVSTSRWLVWPTVESRHQLPLDHHSYPLYSPTTRSHLQFWLFQLFRVVLKQFLKFLTYFSRSSDIYIYLKYHTQYNSYLYVFLGSSWLLFFLLKDFLSFLSFEGVLIASAFCILLLLPWLLKTREYVTSSSSMPASLPCIQ